MVAPHVCSVGIALCTPIPYVNGPAGPRLAPVTVEWHRAMKGMLTPTNINMIHVIEDGKEVGEARQHCVEAVMAMQNRPEHILFVDYDVIPASDAIVKLLMRSRHYPDYDIFAGVYTLKSPVAEPLIYKGWGVGPFWDWTVGDLLTEGITGVHMGMTLIRTSLFDRLDWRQTPAFLTTNESYINKDGVQVSNRGTEDLHFCCRAVEEANAKILVDTSVLCGHQDISSGVIYGLPKDSRPVMGAKWLKPSDEYEDEKKALDLGAGGTRRQWEGYKTYTTDIRPDSGADYVQDTRGLNLPAESFDLVASSHHLEHIPRWEQEEVWKQMFLVCKPGGKIEHVVPSAEWAGCKLAEGECDEHVMNVLYGAQEAHGYDRIFNTHFMAYTKAVATALAESAGFVDVTCEDWRDRESLGYNLIIRGTKPGGPNTEPAIPCSDEDPSCPISRAVAEADLAEAPVSEAA